MISSFGGTWTRRSVGLEVVVVQATTPLQSPESRSTVDTPLRYGLVAWKTSFALYHLTQVWLDLSCVGYGGVEN
jgi:hypothetical protein